jgi:TatD DNase family protein
MFLVDSHCHFDLMMQSKEGPLQLNQIIDRAVEQGVSYFLNVSVSLARFPILLKMADQSPLMSISVGLHPNDQNETVDLNVLETLTKHEKVVAIGETGLDYFRSTGDLDWQRERFRTHIHAAKNTHLPLIVHTRDAKEDTIRLLIAEGAKEVGGVMHCFTEDWEMAKRCLELGFYISFSGIVTFKNAEHIKEVAKKVPLDRILIETDSPYLAPNPKRGASNEPAYVKYTAEYIANLRQMDFAEFAGATTQNFFTLFKGAKRPYV